MGKFDIKEYIKRRFDSYKTPFEVLGVKEKDITDEIVAQAYDEKTRELEGMLKDYKSESFKELKTLIQTTLDNAYSEIKTKEAREKYKKNEQEKEQER